MSFGKEINQHCLCLLWFVWWIKAENKNIISEINMKFLISFRVWMCKGMGESQHWQLNLTCKLDLEPLNQNSISREVWVSALCVTFNMTPGLWSDMTLWYQMNLFDVKLVKLWTLALIHSGMKSAQITFMSETQWNGLNIVTQAPECKYKHCPVSRDWSWSTWRWCWWWWPGSSASSATLTRYTVS